MISEKSGRLDVRAKTSDDMQLDIEVLLTNQHNMEKRTMFYWGKLSNASAEEFSLNYYDNNAIDYLTAERTLNI